MRPISMLVLLALVPASGQILEARGQQEIQPVLRERGQPAQPEGRIEQEPSQNAQMTKQRLDQMLWELPPSVRGVLQNDPSLADRPDYLSTYPQLQAFLKQHPEISRNPSFFFGEPFRRRDDPLDAFAAILAGTGLFIAFMTIVILVGSVARQVVDYRRWLRQTRMQNEIHTKILDRLQSNEDLLAYVQTPAGRNFLQFAPASHAPEPQVSNAPLGRILWSVQAGVVLAALGLGLGFARNTVPDEIMAAFTVLGVIVMSLGLGAVVSAIVAYILSSRLGLLPSRKEASQETNA